MLIELKGLVMTILVVRLLVVSGMVVSIVYCRRTEQDTVRIPVGNQKTHLMQSLVNLHML